MNAQPSAMSSISHHARDRLVVDTWVVADGAGVSSPVIEGRGGRVFVPEGVGTSTRSDRQMPSPDTTLVEAAQVVAVHVPPRRI